MVWNIVLLVVAMLVLFLNVGDEMGLGAPTEASNLAQVVAPRLGVSEARLREELTHELMLRWEPGPLAARATPVGFLTALLAVRLILDWRAACSMKRKAQGG
jgi:hypothetical protein